MAIKFELVKPGDTLYDYHAERAGNSTMRRWSNWPVEILAIDAVAQTARVRWNGNAAQTYTKRQIEGLRRKPGKERDPWAR